MTPTFKRSTPCLVTSIVVVGIAFALPQFAAAQTPCAQWDVSQPWVAMQSNKFTVTFRLRQTGTNLQGTGEHVTTPGGSGPLGRFSGIGEDPVTGTLKGDSIEIETSWGGVYIGKIDNTGRIDGRTYDKKDSTSSATWYSDRRMNCLARVGAAAPPATAQPKPPSGLCPACPDQARVSNDFNGDGHGDILWHNATTGESQVWFMSGSSRVGRATIVEGARPFLVKAPWRIAGTNDFNQDGKADILWHNSSTGETQVWLMNGHRISGRTTVLGENGKATYVRTPWRIVGANDFNQDGKADILWHNSSTGETQVWLMNGHRTSGRATVLGENGKAIFVGTPWHIVGTNDFNRDGRADILWHNSSSGEAQIWFMNGTRTGRRATVDAARDGGGNLVKAPWSIMNH